MAKEFGKVSAHHIRVSAEIPTLRREVNRTPQIAVDFRWLDDLSVANGQFRYAVDLIRGLAELCPEMRFLVLGSRHEPVAEIAEVFRNASWRYRPVPRLEGRGWLYREHLRYFVFLRELRIDLLHALHSFVPLYPPVPVVETVYDMMQELFPEYGGVLASREYRLHKWAFQRFAARAIAISRTTKQDLVRLWGFPEERVDVVYLGPKLPDGQKRLDRPQDPAILAPYNLESRKNLSRLVEAAAKLKQMGRKFRLVLFGRAAITQERELRFRQECSKLGLDGCIELTGRVSEEELVRLYAQSSAFVFPSLYEGFGLPVLEAMNVGARVVAHNASAMAEVVQDAGMLVNMNEVSAIVEGIERALRETELGARARERARQFSRERMAGETLDVYRKTLKMSGD